MAAAIQGATKVSGVRSKRLVADIIELICSSLERGEPVSIRGFGRFKVIALAERVARNPKTGEPALVPMHRTVMFRPNGQFHDGERAWRNRLTNHRPSKL